MNKIFTIITLILLISCNEKIIPHYQEIGAIEGTKYCSIDYSLSSFSDSKFLITESGLYPFKFEDGYLFINNEQVIFPPHKNLAIYENGNIKFFKIDLKKFTEFNKPKINDFIAYLGN